MSKFWQAPSYVASLWSFAWIGEDEDEDEDENENGAMVITAQANPLQLGSHDDKFSAATLRCPTKLSRPSTLVLVAK